MSQNRTTPDPTALAAFLSEIRRNGQLIYRLFTNPQVPLWAKVIPPLTVIYLLSPVDFVPDPVLGLGQMDDLAVLLLGAKLFIELCPTDVVERIRHELIYGRPREDDEVVDATYRVIDDE